VRRIQPGPAQVALNFVLVIGIANLFADLTYEGARSINGQFLATLGASGLAVGFTAGAGELLGYGLRSITGLISDRTGRYWLVTITGYAVNMAAVPALALTGNWPVAAALIMAERTGRAIRKPSTEAMLAHAGHQIGQGWVFGLNEALDQTGATIGPLIVALVLFLKGGYRQGYALLAIPAIVTVATILVARRWFPRPSALEAAPALDSQGFDRRYWYYLVAAGCVAAGFADFALIGYHFQKMSVISPTLIPVYYAVAMGAGAVGALGLGRLVDINQSWTVLGTFLATAFFAPFVFLGGPLIALAGMVLWGIGLAAQESLLRSIVARIVDASRRATAFGLFDTGFGIAWFIGSVVMGYLYGISIPGLVIFSVLLQLIALPLFAFAGLRPRKDAETSNP